MVSLNGLDLREYKSMDTKYTHGKETKRLKNKNKKESKV